MSEEMSPYIGDEAEPSGKSDEPTLRITSTVTSLSVEPVDPEKEAERKDQLKMEKTNEVRVLAQQFLEGYVAHHDLQNVRLLWSETFDGTEFLNYENVWFSVSIIGQVEGRSVIVNYEGVNNDTGRDRPEVTEWLIPEGVDIDQDVKIDTFQTLCEKIDLPSYMEELQIAAIRRRTARLRAERDDIATYFTPFVEPSLNGEESLRAVAELEREDDADTF